MKATTNLTEAKKRLKALNGFSLKLGNHKGLDDGACVMEMVSYVANEPWSDHPKCACPVLTGYAIRLNDRASDEKRQLLKPLILKLINTRSTPAIEKKRYHFLVHRAITVTLPLLTDALELKEISKKLRAFKSGEWEAMRLYCNEIRPTLREAMRKAAAYAAAAAAYAAAAAAYAAAAYAAAAAAYAAAADADAAASPAQKKKWTALRDKIWSEAIKSLSEACEIGAK